MRLQYTEIVFRDVKDSEWSADHIAAHDVTLDEVREAILERPYWMTPGKNETSLSMDVRTQVATYLWSRSMITVKPSPQLLVT